MGPSEPPCPLSPSLLESVNYQKSTIPSLAPDKVIFLPTGSPSFARPCMRRRSRDLNTVLQLSTEMVPAGSQAELHEGVGGGESD